MKRSAESEASRKLLADFIEKLRADMPSGWMRWLGRQHSEDLREGWFFQRGHLYDGGFCPERSQDLVHYTGSDGVCRAVVYSGGTISCGRDLPPLPAYPAAPMIQISVLVEETHVSAWVGEGESRRCIFVSDLDNTEDGIELWQDAMVGSLVRIAAEALESEED